LFGVFVVCKIKPGMGEAFVAAAKRDRDGSRTEAGNLRFDVLRATAPAEPGEPEVFYLFEVYRSAEAFAAHQDTPHYRLFRDETAPMMAEPRQGLRYVPIHADPWE
jgi:autoinducer 2-degrading protein